jgi:CBS-domain-containing membrane protein
MKPIYIEPEMILSDEEMAAMIKDFIEYANQSASELLEQNIQGNTMLQSFLAHPEITAEEKAKRMEDYRAKLKPVIDEQHRMVGRMATKMAVLRIECQAAREQEQAHLVRFVFPDKEKADEFFHNWVAVGMPEYEACEEACREEKGEEEARKMYVEQFRLDPDTRVIEGFNPNSE